MIDVLWLVRDVPMELGRAENRVTCVVRRMDFRDVQGTPVVYGIAPSTGLVCAYVDAIYHNKFFSLARARRVAD
ncbi:unnamed protein product, partial [Ectocarpus sp. 4 AP-2014]